MSTGPTRGTDCDTVMKNLPAMARAGQKTTTCTHQGGAMPTKAQSKLLNLPVAPKPGLPEPVVTPDDEVQGMSYATINLNVRPGIQAVGDGWSPNIPWSCSASANQNGGFYYLFRWEACNGFVYRVDVVRTSDQELLGRGFFVAFEWQQLNLSARTWTHEVVLEQYDGWDAAANGMWTYVSAYCSDACSTIKAEPADQWTYTRKGVIYWGRWTHYQNSAVVDFSLQATGFWNWTPEGGDPAFGVSQPFDRVRCDSLSYIRGSGCVFSDHPADFPIGANDASVLQSAQFIRDAQNGLVGNPGRIDGTPLTRIEVGSATYNANISAKDAACARLTRPSTEYDCDEYPFASTAEGAGSGNFMVRYVDASQNRAAGGRLSAIYAAQRVAYGDKFFVLVY